MSRSPLELIHLSFPEPVGESHQVHRRGIDRLLQVCPSQPAIAAAAQIKATHALGDTAFHPGSQRAYWALNVSVSCRCARPGSPRVELEAAPSIDAVGPWPRCNAIAPRRPDTWDRETGCAPRDHRRRRAQASTAHCETLGDSGRFRPPNPTQRPLSPTPLPLDFASPSWPKERSHYLHLMPTLGRHQ